MAEILEDGFGTGSKAKIRDGRVFVNSRSEVAEAVSATDGKAFIVSARCRTAGATSGAFMSIQNNDPENDIKITRIYVYPQTLTDSTLLCSQVFDATIAGGTDVSSTAIINKNRGNSTTFDLTVKVSDASADATYTGGVEYHCFPLLSRSQNDRNMNGTNILPSGKSITFGWSLEGGGTATDDQIVYFAVNIIKTPKNV
jgi:hypothetical protein